MTQPNQLHAALTGIAIAAATHWARYDDDTQRRLRNARLDAEEALDIVRETQSRGDAIRSRLPTVMDATVGLSIANPVPTTASVVPVTAPLQRPDLAMSMEKSIEDMSWPPVPGEYDAKGMVKQAGELTSMFLALTYEEVRAFVQGLAQSRPPGREGKVQIYTAANALVTQLCGQKLSAQQYREAWARVFGQPVAAPPTNTPVLDVHSDPTRPPSVAAVGVNVASVTPLSSQSIPGYPFANRNSDRLMRFRLTTNGAVGTAQPLASIQFGTEYRCREPDGSSLPMQPGVFVSAPGHRCCVDLVTSTGFVLLSTVTLPTGSTLDVFVRVEG